MCQVIGPHARHSGSDPHAMVLCYKADPFVFSDTRLIKLDKNAFESTLPILGKTSVCQCVSDH
jgi:hypothetical protein